MAKKFPFIPQTDNKDCGPACVTMIAQYFGGPASPAVGGKRAGKRRTGVSLLGLSRMAEAMGFRTIAAEVSLEVVVAEKLFPFIAHWSGCHYVVVYKVSAQRVWIADPARELLVLSKAVFLEQWSGIALLLEPTREFFSMDSKKRERS